MSQIDVATNSSTKQRTSGRKARIEAFLRAFEWTWTSAVLFSLALVFFLLISAVIMPSFWMYCGARSAGPPHRSRGVPEAAVRHEPDRPLVQRGYLMVRDAIAMGLTTVPFVLLLVISAACRTGARSCAAATGSRPSGGYR
jgi:hypothetical protein